MNKKEDVHDFLNHIGAKKQPGVHEKRLTQKAQHISKWLKYIPGIVFIGLGNSVAMNTAHRHSDIDLFIICHPGTIWSVRVSSILITTILGVRRINLIKRGENKYESTEKVAGKVCLSFFITTDHLDLRPIMIERDIYMKTWITTLIPLYDTERVHEQFLEANGVGSKKGEVRSEKSQGNKWNLIYYLLSSILNLLLKALQYSSASKGANSTSVIVNNSILKFHEDDKRQELSVSFYKQKSSIDNYEANNLHS